MANDFSGFNAEAWAQEALMTLEEEIGVSQQFNRDFDDDFGEKGEVVHARRLGTFVGKRLVEGDTITSQDATSAEQLIKLNQHIHVAFPISDRDLRRSFRDLRKDFIQPAVRGVIEAIDIVSIGEQYQSYKNQAGKLNSTIGYNDLVNLNKIMSQNNVPRDQRALWVGPTGEADLLKTDKLTEARMTGSGAPLLNGQIGRGAGFDIGMSQMIPETITGHAVTSGLVNEGDGYPATTLAITVDGFSAAITDGSFVSIDGQVHRVAGTTGGATPTVITIESPGLHSSVADNAVVVSYTAGAVDNTSDYAADWDDWIIIQGAAITAAAEFPQLGEGIAFGTASDVYGVMEVDFDNLKMRLNRPLDTGISDDDTVNIFPAGAYNFAFRPGMATLVVKSMPPPPPNTGVAAAVAQAGGWSLRTMLSYSHTGMGYTYSIDCLVGVKTTDAAQGALLLGSL